MLLAAVRQLQDLVRQEQPHLISGAITHSLLQLQDYVAARLNNQEATMEAKFKIIIGSVEEQAGQLKMVNEKELTRQVDFENRTLGMAKEIATTRSASVSSMVDPGQLRKDVMIGASGRTMPLDLPNVTLDPKTIAGLQRELTKAAHQLISEGVSVMAIKQGLENLNITDAAGQVFKAATDELFKPEGKVALYALEAVKGSPNFGPAMEVLFGPNGKVAGAAVEAAAMTNLTPAGQSLEKKLEEGVTQALDQAGTAAKEHAAGKLTESISAGATSLGNVMTSIPQLYDSVSNLGEAWDKPLNSTKDYMNLLAAAGGAVSQAGQVMQAFSGITQVATAVQAAFNAVMALNPFALVIIAVVALIAAIALIIIYWDEVKLAVLIAANYISIQLKKIGYFFVGLGTLIGQVWDWITATVANVGISIVNAFISAGVAIENFFIGVINWILGKYNDLADSALGDLIGLSHADLIPEVDVKTKLIPPKEVPTIDVDAAFKPRQITGGLESQIAAQEKVIAEGKQKEAEREAAKPAEPAAGAAPAGGMGGLGRPAVPAPGGALPGAAAVPGGAAGAAAARGADQSIRVEGGINVTINAERLEADSARLLTDEFIAKVQARLGELRATQDFRVGARPQQA
jgi:hypothetical protein